MRMCQRDLEMLGCGTHLFERLFPRTEAWLRNEISSVKKRNGIVNTLVNSRKAVLEIISAAAATSMRMRAAVQLLKRNS
jgi:hypothetical protein